MRVLAKFTDNELTLNDPKSGEKTSLYYRDPTSSEIVNYHNNTIKRVGNKVTGNMPANRIAGGKLVLTGIKDGQLGVQDKDGIERAISSNPNAAEYEKDWRLHVEEHLACELMLLGIHVFESTHITSDEGQNTEDEENIEGK